MSANKFLRYSSVECQKAMVDEFDKEVSLLVKQMKTSSKNDLRKQILRQEQSYLNKPETIGLMHLTLGQVIYRERFNREVILKGELK